MPPKTKRHDTMTAAEIAAIREDLGLDRYQWGELLGFEGNQGSLYRSVIRLENGERRVRPVQALLARAYKNGFRPNIWPSAT